MLNIRGEKSSIGSKLNRMTLLLTVGNHLKESGMNKRLSPSGKSKHFNISQPVNDLLERLKWFSQVVVYLGGEQTVLEFGDVLLDIRTWQWRY